MLHRELKLLAGAVVVVCGREVEGGYAFLAVAQPVCTRLMALEHDCVAVASDTEGAPELRIGEDWSQAEEREQVAHNDLIAVGDLARGTQAASFGASTQPSQRQKCSLRSGCQSLESLPGPCALQSQ